MRARELRDIIEVLVLPSLWSALRELNKPRHGNRNRARLLVKQSFEQLRGALHDPTSSAMPELELGGPASVDVQHDFSHDQTTEGFGICRCGVVEDSEASARSCPGGEPADRSE